MIKKFLNFYSMRYLVMGMVAIFALYINSHAHTAPIGYVLQIDHSPAVCRIEPGKKRARQCLEGYTLTVAGLIPLGVNYQQCVTSSMVNLSPIQKRLLMRIMPDEPEQVRLWRNVGSCVSMNASQYFRMMVNLADKLNIPREITSPNTIVVNRDYLIQRFVQQNKGLPASAVRLQCQTQGNHSVLMRIQICYQNNGNYAACTFPAIRACNNQVMIQGVY